MCKERGLKYLSSVWNKQDLKWIAGKMDFFKIGSGDLTAYDQINALCKYKKPILISTGLSNMREIKETISFIKSRNNFYKNRENIAILQCTSSYPANNNEINLNVINNYKKLGYPVGYSHHNKSSYPLEAAYTLGYEIFEFHFTDTRRKKIFRDHKISLTKDMVKKFIKKIKLIKTIKGNFLKEPTYNEIKSKNVKTFRRGLYLNKDLKKNTKIKGSDLVSLRPESGISAKNYFKLINKRAKKKIKRFAKLNLKDFK